MKQYVLDEFRPPDYERVKEYLDARFERSSIGGVYWIYIDEEILNDEQKSHFECRPHYFAAELTEAGLCFELLARTNNRLKCSCMVYACERQRNWLINIADSILDKLEIKI